MELLDPTSIIFDYLEGPRYLEESIFGMSKADMMLRPIDGKWSTLEVICHITDMEIVYADRIKRIIAEDMPEFKDANQEIFAKRLFYHEREPTEEIHLIYSIRNHISKILKQLDQKDWFRSGIHSVYGEMSLFQIINNIILHIPHHIQFIEEKRKKLQI